MENIRITSGKFRGRVIKSPKSSLTHPMGSREKMALFNMISEYLPGAMVLDAYAGSGALGVEAISRGAKRVIFVEKNPRITKTIKENLKSLGLEEITSVSEEDAKNFLSNDNFDIIIADPPYDKFETDGAKNISKLLKKDGVLILSHPNEAPIIDGLSLQKTSKYSRAFLSIYKPI